MAETQASGEHLDQSIVYAGYGEVMHRFQTFELLLCQFLVRGIKRGSLVAQVMENIIKWDNTIAGAIVRGVKSQVSPTFTRTGECRRRRLAEADMTVVLVGNGDSDDVHEENDASGTCEAASSAGGNDPVLAASANL